MNPTETADPTWKNLYITGGVAALLAVFIFRRNLGAELSLMGMMGTVKVPPVPVDAAGWIRLFQSSRLVGLTYLNFFDIIKYLLAGLLFLALYIALRKTTKSAMLIATILGSVGITAYIASNQSFAMLALSARFAAATTTAEQSNLLAGLIISIVMLRSSVFGKAAAIMGILANGIGLCYFLFLVFAPAAIWVPHSISAPFRVIWYFLIALRLFKLARE